VPIHDISPQYILAALNHRHAFVDLVVIKYQCLALFGRHMERRPTLAKSSGPTRKAFVEKHHERELTSLTRAPFEIAIHVGLEALPPVVAIKAKPLVEPARLPPEPVLDQQFPGPIPPLRG